MNNNSRLLIIVFYLCIQCKQVKPQELIVLTLKDAIKLAQKNSFTSQKVQDQFMVNEWRFKAFQKGRLPTLRLSTNPISFDRSVGSEFNFDNQRYEYIFRQRLDNDLRLFVEQPIQSTGGRIFLSSYLGRLQTFGDQNQVSYTGIPISIGLEQSLLAHNPFKWDRKIEPLLKRQAQAYLKIGREGISQMVVQYFFALVEAKLNFEIANFNYATSDTLLQIGKKRSEIGTLKLNDLAELERSFIESEIEKLQAQTALRLAQVTLKRYIGIDSSTKLTPILPENLPRIQIDQEQAKNLFFQNYPDIMGFDYQRLQAERELDKVRKENGPQVSILGAFGLNKRTDKFSDVYAAPLNELQSIQVSMEVPLIDWGFRKSLINQFESNLDLTESEASEAIFELETELREQISTFNQQAEIIDMMKRSENLAYSSYDLTLKRFLLGNVDLIKLHNARNSLNSTRRQFLMELKRYWTLYYGIQTLTLFDFEAQVLIE